MIVVKLYLLTDIYSSAKFITGIIVVKLNL